MPATATTTPLRARHIALRSLIGWPAYRALLSGQPLQVWRNSSPHNYWVEDKRGKMLWHSECDQPRQLPDMRLFRLKRHSREKVIEYWGVDSGMHRHSFYLLNRRGALK